MNLTDSLSHFAEEINGKFLEYSDDITILTIPIEGNNYQCVTTHLTESNGNRIVEFSAKVRELCSQEGNHKIILKLNQELCHSRIIIREWQLKVLAEVLLSNCNGQLMKDMILEVATVAHHLQHEIANTVLVKNN